MSSTNTKCRYRFVSLTAEGMYVWWFEPQAEAQCSRFSSPNTVYICPYIHQTAMGKGGAGKGAAPKRWPRVLTSADDSWLPWFALICLGLSGLSGLSWWLHSSSFSIFSSIFSQAVLGIGSFNELPASHGVTTKAAPKQKDPATSLPVDRREAGMTGAAWKAWM